MLTATPPTRRTSRALLLAALTTVLLSLLPGAPAAAGAAEDADFLSRLNSARAAAGLPAMAPAADLASNAAAHAAAMAGSGSLHHNPNLAQQVSGWTALGENVGYGGSVGVIHDALMNSAGHRANILSTTFTQVGIGTAYSGGRLWVAQVFRKPTAGFPLYGAIGALYPAYAGPLGAPTSAEYAVPGGRAQDFAGGQILWSAATGARVVFGAIGQEYRRLGGAASALRLPVTDELPTPDRVGRFNHFQSGSLYWTPWTGAQEVRGAIRDRWAAQGWEKGPLGYPTTDETGTPDRAGRFNHFQFGSVYWTPWTGAHDVRGAIRDRWASLGWENSPLAYPVTGETRTPDGVGRFNHFQFGSVYWTPATGAHEVRGAIRDRWAAQGWERGRLGYPVSGEYAVPGGRRSDFQGGSITWDAATGATTVR